MALTDGQEALNMEQIADAINRQKLSNQKDKNNLINWGMDNQEAFRQKYGSSILQPNTTVQSKGISNIPISNSALSQPDIESYLTGQGYKKSQGYINPQIARLLNFNDLGSYNGNYYYKGDYDPSTAKWGADNLYKIESAPGQYNTYNENGSLLGTSFGSVKDAIAAYQKKYNAANPAVSPVEGLPRGYPLEDPIFDTNDYQNRFNAYENNLANQNNPTWDRTDPYSGGALEDWEVLGQMITRGTPIPRIDYTSPRYTAQAGSGGLSELISGRNSLYGSTPLIANNKIMGYKFNPVVTTGNEFAYQAPNYIKRSDTHGSTTSEDSLARIYERPDLWNAYAKNLGNNELYVDAENIDNLPGWTNAGTSAYNHQSSGNFGKVASVLGTILSFTPLAPLGLAISTLSQLANGNHLGAITGAIVGGLGMAGVGDKLGSSLGIGSNAGKGLLQGGLGTLGSAISGKDPTQSILSGLGSYLGGELGDITKSGLGGLFDSVGVVNIVSDIGGKAAGGALQNLISGKNVGEGAALGGLSGGLGGMLSSLTDSGMSPEQKQKNLRSSQNLAKTVSKLALSKQQKRKV